MREKTASENIIGGKILVIKQWKQESTRITNSNKKREKDY